MLLFLHLIKVINTYGKGLNLKKRIYSNSQIVDEHFKINSNFSFVKVSADNNLSFDVLYEFGTKKN